MNEAFRQKLDSKISEWIDWKEENPFSTCRMVQYCGPEMIGSLSLEEKEIESRIKALICEGFYVEWNTKEDASCFLRVWEFGGPEPDWKKVFEEVDLIEL